MQKHSVLAVIPVRIGSKGIRKKNLHVVGRKTLTAMAVETVLRSSVDAIMLSADDDDLLNECKNVDLDQSRLLCNKRAIASDMQSSEEAVCEVYESSNDLKEKFPHAMLVQATSPGLRAEDINRALAVYDGINPVISVSPAVGFFYRVISTDEQAPWLEPLYPHAMRKMAENGKPRRLFRDEYESLYLENGAFYLAPLRSWQLNDRLLGLPRGVKMSHWRSHEIDEPLDLVSWQRCYDLWTRHD